MSSRLSKAKQIKNETLLGNTIKRLDIDNENLIKKVEQLQQELTDIKSDYRRVNKENQELKEDNHFKDDQIKNDNNYQDELIKCNDSSCNKRHSAVVLNWALIGVILLIITGATWSMR